jgi:dienelactone hydrolase
MATRADVSFPSGGQRCGGWPYLPMGVTGRVPCVVMAHGTTGTMNFGLARYAQRFAAAGFAVLVFDYRHFGASDGWPRQLIRVGRQVADWRAAVRFARMLPQVDPDRVALWGTSLGGGHVVTVAADDPSIAAVVAQLPFMGVNLHGSSPRTPRVTRTLFTAAIRDAIGGVFRRAPVTIPMVGEPGAVAVFAGTEDNAVARTLAAEAPEWRNEMAARSAPILREYVRIASSGRQHFPLPVGAPLSDFEAIAEHYPVYRIDP